MRYFEVSVSGTPFPLVVEAMCFDEAFETAIQYFQDFPLRLAEITESQALKTINSNRERDGPEPLSRISTVHLRPIN